MESKTPVKNPILSPGFKHICAFVDDLHLLFPKTDQDSYTAERKLSSVNPESDPSALKSSVSQPSRMLLDYGQNKE